jgi:hypothetical protein
VEILVTRHRVGTTGLGLVLANLITSCGRA